MELSAEFCLLSNFFTNHIYISPFYTFAGSHPGYGFDEFKTYLICGPGKGVIKLLDSASLLPSVKLYAYTYYTHIHKFICAANCY